MKTFKQFLLENYFWNEDDVGHYVDFFHKPEFEQHLSALKLYQSSHFRPINSKLRYGTFSPKNDEFNDSEINYHKALSERKLTHEDLINHLDTLINQKQNLSDKTVYRGINKNSSQKNILNNLQKGDIFVDKGFISTSHDEDTAYDFKNGGHLLNIKVPKQHNMLVNNFNSLENEIILPRHSLFRVEKNDNKYNELYMTKLKTDTSEDLHNIIDGDDNKAKKAIVDHPLMKYEHIVKGIHDKNEEVNQIYKQHHQFLEFYLDNPNNQERGCGIYGERNGKSIFIPFGESDNRYTWSL